MEPAPGLPGAGAGGPARIDPRSAQRRRPLFWLALAFSAGIALDDLLQPSLPALGGLGLASGMAALAAVVLTQAAAFRGLVLFAAAVLVGICGGAFRHASVARFPLPTDVTCRTPSTPCLAWLEGTVVEVRRGAQREANSFWTVVVDALGPGPDELTAAAGRVQLCLRADAATQAPDPFAAGPARVREGDRVRLLGRLEAPAPATLPGGFDAANYLARQGIRRVGEPAAGSVAVVGCAPPWRLDLLLRRWSGRLADRNVEMLGAQRAALVNSLLLGRRDGLERSDREAFSRAGTAHLLAISGLHLQFLAAALWWLLKALRLSRRRLGMVVCAFVWGYALLTGAQAPVVRAAVMVSVYLGALLFFRGEDALSALGAAALLLLGFSPDDLFTAGFQLSFLAVLALVTVRPSLEAAWRGWRKFPEEWVVDREERLRLRVQQLVRRAVFISLAAWLGTAPAVAWHMGNFNVVSVFANLVAVPLASLAMLGGALAMLAGGFLGVALSAPLTLLLGFNRLIGAWRWASLDVPSPPVVLVAAYAAFLVWAWWGQGRSATLPRLAVLLPAAMLSLLGGMFFRALPSAPRATVLDLARGRATLVETPAGHAALIDCGGEQQGPQLAEFLRRQGHRELALLVVTQDCPEAVGGAGELVKRVAVRRAVLPRSLAPSGALRELIGELECRGVVWGPADFTGRLQGPDDMRWEFTTDAPASGPPGAGSEALTVRVGLAGTAVLYSVTRSSEGVKRLLARAGGLLKADALRLIPGPAGHWPVETALLISQSGARTLIAGEGSSWPEEGTGLDLMAVAKARGLRVLCPSREGSLRVGESGPENFLAFRGGQWREVFSP